MTSVVLPKEIGYSDMLPSLPDECRKTSIVVMPVSGQTYGESSLIQFDLPSKDFLDGSSMYLRFKVKLTSNANAELKGCPATTFFSKLETMFGSQIVESTNNYGQLQDMITNVTLNASQKQGLASAYGYSVVDGKVPCGRLCTAINEEFTVAVPFNCLLSSASKLIPLGNMPTVRIQLLTDVISNIFTTTVVPTAYTLSNLELCYDSIYMGSSVDSMIRGMDKIYIKSQAYTSTGSVLGSGTSGSVSLVYNQRLSSIKSLFTLFTGNFVESLNRQYDSYDPTQSSGSLQYEIASVAHPSRAVSTINNKASFMLELKSACGGIHNAQTDNFSVTPTTFNKEGKNITTYDEAAQFIFGTNVERLHTNGALLTGISTENSPISLRIDTSLATAGSYNCQMIALYDALIEVNPQERSAYVKQ